MGKEAGAGGGEKPTSWPAGKGVSPPGQAIAASLQGHR